MKNAKQYKVIISDRARKMLAVHIQFLAQVSPAAALKIKHEIIEAIRSLTIMPDRHSFLDNQHIHSNKYHKMFVGTRYLILYQIRDQLVYVDYVVDCRQDYQWMIK